MRPLADGGLDRGLAWRWRGEMGFVGAERMGLLSKDWKRIAEIAERIPDTVGNVYVAKDYTTRDLKRDLLATIPRLPEG